MGTLSIKGTLNVVSRWVDGTASISEKTDVPVSLANGTGSGQADAFWSDVVEIATDSAQTIDLTALPVSAFGATANLFLASVKQVGLVNESANVGVTVEPGASNGWSQIGTLELGKSGVLMIYSPASGLPVTNTSKTITITNTHEETTLTGDTTTGSAAVTGLSSTTALAAGMLVTGTGIPDGAKIASVTSATAITLSAAATATDTAVSLTFQWPAATVKVYVAGVLD